MTADWIRKLRGRLPQVLVRWIAAVILRLVGPRGARPRHRRPGSLPITFVIWNVYTIGGTVRTVVRQANALAERGRDVTVVSVMCHHHQEGPFFEVHPDVRLEILVDRHHLPDEPGLRGRVRRALDQRPVLSSQFCVGREAQASLLTDLLLLGRLARQRGVVIGTRVGLNLAIARFAHPAAFTIAQEHLQYRRYAPLIRRAIRRHFGALDVVACLTNADADTYRADLPDARPAVIVVPNAVPDRFPPEADLDEQCVVSVGLTGGKRPQDVIDAFASISSDEPEWRLRIIGDGRRREALQERIDSHGLADRIELPGSSRDVDGELRRASILALASRSEGFSLVILEAMAVGLPVVSYAVPTGPIELVDDGVNGFLVPDGDVAAMAARLRTLMRDRDLRGALGARGRAKVADFTVATVTDRWLEVFDRLERGVPVPAPPDPPAEAVTSA